MAQTPPPDPEITGWLTALGITALCQWDVLVFLYRHQTTLLGPAELARLLGYTSTTIVSALDDLETHRLVARSRVSQGVRLYHVRVPPDSPHGAAFARLSTLVADHTGRVRVAQHLRREERSREA